MSKLPKFNVGQILIKRGTTTVKRKIMGIVTGYNNIEGRFGYIYATDNINSKIKERWHVDMFNNICSQEQLMQWGSKNIDL